jgi:hypothetical protein
MMCRNVRWSDEEEEVDRGGAAARLNAEADMGGLGYSAEKLKSGSNIVVDLWKLELGRLKGVHFGPLQHQFFWERPPCRIPALINRVI